jgi:murein L,D-transpeptidase YcbB/YkuD
MTGLTLLALMDRYTSRVWIEIDMAGIDLKGRARLVVEEERIQVAKTLSDIFKGKIAEFGAAQMEQESVRSAEEAARIREGMGVTQSLGPEDSMVDVTDTDMGQLSSPEPLFEMAEQVREPSFEKTQLPETEATSQRQQPTDFLSTEINKILESEGGFQQDSSDSGNFVNGTLIGTNKGITANALAEFRGVDPTSITVEDIKGITDEQATEIYTQNYYLKPKINQLPQDIQDTVMDMYVNSGRNAVKILQRLAGVEADGVIGPATIKAVEEANITRNQYADARVDYYKKVAESNPSQNKFLQGWVNRANKYRDE